MVHNPAALGKGATQFLGLGNGATFDDGQELLVHACESLDPVELAPAGDQSVCS